MLLMVLPLLSFKGENHSAQAGLRELYRIGTSNCKHDGIIDPNTMCNKYDWVTKEGFKSKLRNYVNSQTYNDDGTVQDKELLWLFIPDFNNNGMLSSIKDVKDVVIDPKTKSVKFSKDKVYWK